MLPSLSPNGPFCLWSYSASSKSTMLLGKWLSSKAFSDRLTALCSGLLCFFSIVFPSLCHVPSTSFVPQLHPKAYICKCAHPCSLQQHVSFGLSNALDLFLHSRHFPHFYLFSIKYLKTTRGGKSLQRRQGGNYTWKCLKDSKKSWGF